MAQLEPIKERDTEKLFYRKYPFKLVIRLPLHFTESTFRVAYHLMKESADALNIVYRSRIDGCFCSFFFLTKDDVDRFSGFVKGNIVELWRPHNDTVMELLDKKENVIVRRSLFYNRYRYKLTCPSWSYAIFTEVHEEVKKYNEEEPGRFEVSYSYPLTVYAKDDADVMLVRLTYPEYFTRATKVVLKDEVDAELNGTELSAG